MDTLRIFISSPGDVAEERERARQVVQGLRRRYVQHFTLVPVFWEDMPLTLDMSFQQGIELVLSRDRGVDVAVFILWSRLGSPLGPRVTKEDGSEYRSGTERELAMMLEARAAQGGQRPQILAYARQDEASFEEALRGRSTTEKEELLRQKKLVETFLKEEFHDAEKGVNVRAYHTFSRPQTFAERLRVHLQEILDGLCAGRPVRPVWEIDRQGPPFRGLEAFAFEHAEIFFGREDEVAEARVRLTAAARRGTAFLLIGGASGTGKSSLAAAGLVPEIVAHETDEQVGRWLHAACTPAAFVGDPAAGLARILAAAVPALGERDDPADFAAALARDPVLAVKLVLLPALKAAARPGSGGVRLVLLVDQLEELFTDPRLGPLEQAACAEILGALATSGSVWVVATLRGDWYPRLLECPALVALKTAGGQLDLVPPEIDAVRRMIESPAALAGLTYEQTGATSLADRILRDVADRAELLPLLEDLLRELFERRSPAGLLTAAAYESLGGIEGSLAKRAEASLAALPVEVQLALPEVLRRLVATGEEADVAAVRRRAPLDAFPPASPARQLVDRLVSDRLATASAADDGTAEVAIAHEAILRVWPRAAAWIRDNAEFLRVRDHVEQAQRRWEGSGRDASLLLADGLPAEEGRQLLSGNSGSLSTDLADFVRRSLAHHEAAAARTVRRTRAVIAALAALALLAAAGGLLAWRKEQAVRLALTDVAARSADYRKLLHQASDNDLAAGIEIWTAFEAEAVKGRMLAGIAGEPKFKEALAYWIRALRLAPDNRPAAAWLFTALANTLARQPLVPPPDIGSLTLCEHAETSGNGMRSLAVPASDLRQLVAWDARTGEPLAPPRVHASDVWAVAISPGGRFIATVERHSRQVNVFDADRGLARHAVLPHDRLVSAVRFGPDDCTMLSLESDRAADEAPPAPDDAATAGQRLSCWNLEDRDEATIRWTTDVSEGVELQDETPVSLGGGTDFSAMFSDDSEVVFVKTVAGKWHGRDLATGETRDHVLPSKPDVPLSPGQNGAVLAWNAGPTRPSQLLAGTGGTDVADIVMHRESAVVTIRATRAGCFAGACGLWRVPDRCIRLDAAPAPPTFSTEDWDAAGAPTAPAFRRIDEHTVQLLDPVTQGARGLPLKHPEVGDDNGLVASRDGRFVLSKDYDGRLRLWDAITGRLLCPSFGDGRLWEEARFSNDGMRVLARCYSSEDRGARDLVWQLDVMRAMLDLPAVTPAALDWAERVVGVRFSPSGELETVPAAEQRAVLDLPVPAELTGLGLTPLRSSR